MEINKVCVLDMLNSILDESIDLHHYYKGYMAAQLLCWYLNKFIFLKAWTYWYSQFSIACGHFFNVIAVENYGKWNASVAL